MTLRAALTLTALRRIELYEPALVLAGHARPMAWVPHYEEEISRGDLAGAMVACMKGTPNRGDVFTALPSLLPFL